MTHTLPLPLTRSLTGRPVARGWTTPFVLYALTFLAVNLHLLRNASGMYVAFPLALYVVTFLFQIRRDAGLARTSQGVHPSLALVTPLAWIFLYGTAYMTAVSFCYLTSQEVLNGAMRVWFAPPLLILAKDAIRSEQDVTRMLTVIVMFIAVGCLTVPLQVVTGPIPWFVESSSRGGMDRFGSLFGNLTAIGCVGGLGLVVSLISSMSYFLRFACCVIIGGSMMFSLQKAGVINLVVAPAVFLLFGGISLQTRLSRAISVMIPCIAGIIYMSYVDDQFSDYSGYVARKLGLGFGATGGVVDDYGISENLQERLVETVMMLFDFYGWLGIFCGVGVMGLGGTAGLPDYEMAHNTYGDLLFSGGVFYLLAFLALQAAVLLSLFHLKRLATIHRDQGMHTNVCTLICLTLVYFINLPAGSGQLVQPNLCSLFYVTVGVIMGHYHRRAAELGQRALIPQARMSRRSFPTAAIGPSLQNRQIQRRAA